MFLRSTTGRILVAVFAVMAVLLRPGAAQQGSIENQAGAAIAGDVVDSSGKAVAGATVHLQRKDGQAVAETKTDAAGVFEFRGIAAGRYSLAADQAALWSATATVDIAPGERRRIELVVKESEAGQAPRGASAGSAAQAMEFADQPNFTVAGVTDWTAAGGHGSDVSLRTSEALTRETVALKAGDNAAKAAGGNPPGSADAERTLRAALTASPESLDANRKMGAFYLRAGRYAESIPFLKAGYRARPEDRVNELDLAVALKENGEFAGAREHVKSLLKQGDSADLHRLAGEIAEKLGDPLAAVHELETAAREESSENNYFEWGSELLVHRAVLQAREVFQRGAESFPKSSRMLTALGASLFASALYNEAAQRLCEASDLNPADPEPYLFMGKIEMVTPDPLPCVEQKLARFAGIEPTNALAVYYHAMAIWKQKGRPADPAAAGEVESMLTHAVALDPNCAEAHLQLGNLSYQQQNYAKAIEQYRKAVEADPRQSEAHYRLGLALDRTGEQAGAKREFDLHDKIEKEQAAEVERQRREIKQYLVVEPDRTTPAAPK